MPVLHVSVTSPLPPQETLQRLTDFSPARAKNWANVDDKNLIVHGHGDGWAEVTEGNKIGWERERYTWDAAAGTVSAVTLNSNIWASGSGWNYTIMPDDTGSRVEVTASMKFGFASTVPPSFVAESISPCAIPDTHMDAT